jgi:hypothetical protein
MLPIKQEEAASAADYAIISAPSPFRKAARRFDETLVER